MNKKFSTLVASLLLAGGVLTVNAQVDSPAMPRSAAFVGADVTELVKVGTGTNNYESNGFYQLAIDDGTKVLAMVWDNVEGKYKLSLATLANVNTPLDNTLWKISASWDQTSGTINYIYVNKATLLPLQVAVPEDLDTEEAALVQGAVTNWVWNTNVEDLETTAIKSAVSTTETVHLVTTVTGGDDVQVVKILSNGSLPGTSTAVELKAVEAGRVILTAEQINSKLNNAEGIESTRFDFIFDPEVQNPDPTLAKNIMSELAWVAKGREYSVTETGSEGELVEINTTNVHQIPDFSTYAAPTKDIDDGYVQFESYKDPSKVLMVDTAYFDADVNNHYDLKLAAKELKKTESVYNVAVTAGTAYVTFQDQSLFKVIYEPTYDRVLLQAKQITKITKADLKDGKAWAYQGTASTAGNDGYVVATAVTAGTLAAIDATDPAEYYKPVTNNLVKFVYLTNSPVHSELTVGLPDADDVDAAEEGFCGALTTIKLKGSKDFGQWTFANIEDGYYYIQNAKTQQQPLMPVGGWAYQDLTATNESTGGNVVYSAEQFITMPSAQWQITGNAGYFTIKNRESKQAWSTQYWYKVKDAAGNDIADTYTNYGTFNGAGISTGAKDTIRIVKVANDVFNNKLNGYLNIAQNVAMADTSVFTLKYVTPLEVNLGMVMQSDSVLKMTDGEAMNFKLERVTKNDVKYGIDNKLERVAYYIYLDEVSSNSTEGTGYHHRKYIVLEGGKYRLDNIVVRDNADGTTTAVNGEKRANFYVKEIGEPNKNYVLVDPDNQSAPSTGLGTAADGVRMAMDQTSLEMRANGLPSVAENVYTNSLLNLVKAAAGNYVSELAYGDTVNIFSEDYPEVVMYENAGLLAMSSLEAGREYNTSMFVDTAYVRDNTAKPQYMFVLRAQEDPNCNFPNHNHHAVEGDYLMHLQDSAAVDVKYTWENRKFARLGFIPARHEGDTLLVKSSKFTGNDAPIYVDRADTYAGKDTIDLADNSKDQYCTFALRYVDTARDAFYLETLYKKGTPADRYNPEVADVKGWVRWHNGVPVVVNDLSQAGKFNFEPTSEDPTANDEINAEAISVIAGNGSVTVKGAEGKNVVITNVLGQTI
ncbi:DUF6383 domain-containing protein, partial [uncultured Parabacteroides sp.]|uniref:DUF6383 domain-containing protein n=1 Tax=uncultured Parabacteroides sp. TaxID=512312 RepID=UPI00259B7B59